MKKDQIGNVTWKEYFSVSVINDYTTQFVRPSSLFNQMQEGSMRDWSQWYSRTSGYSYQEVLHVDVSDNDCTNLLIKGSIETVMIPSCCLYIVHVSSGGNLDHWK